MGKRIPLLPLVYSCSGCSNVAQLANRVAVAMDREGEAEMSCIAGVGAGIAPLVKVARSGRHIIAIDGCHLHCVTASLARVGVAADAHVVLSEHGLRKRYGKDCDDADYALARAAVDVAAGLPTAMETCGFPEFDRDQTNAQ